MAEPNPAAAAPDTLSREFWHERIQSARRINLLRFCGVSAFFALFVVLGGILQLPAWTGNLGLFTIFWAVTAVVYWTSRRFDSVAGVATLAIALIDVPLVFLLQWATFPTSPSPSGVAGFTLGVYVLLLILAALSLENWYIYFTAAVAAVFEVALQYLADVSVGGMISTVIVLAIAAATCSYARTRLVELVARVVREIAEQRRAEQALREAERLASLGTLAAGVAHEINTPLTYVVANLGLIAERLGAVAGRSRAGPWAGGLAARLAEIEATIAEVRDANQQLVTGVGTQLTRGELHVLAFARPRRRARRVVRRHVAARTLPQRGRRRDVAGRGRVQPASDAAEVVARRGPDAGRADPALDSRRSARRGASLRRHLHRRHVREHGRRRVVASAEPWSPRGFPARPGRRVRSRPALHGHPSAASRPALPGESLRHLPARSARRGVGPHRPHHAEGRRRHRLPDRAAPARPRHGVGVSDGRHDGVAAHEPGRQAGGVRHARRWTHLAAPGPRSAPVAGVVHGEAAGVHLRRRRSPRALLRDDERRAVGQRERGEVVAADRGALPEIYSVAAATIG